MSVPSSADLVQADGTANRSLSSQRPKAACQGCDQVALLNNCNKVEMGYDIGMGSYYAKYHCPMSDMHIFRYSDGFVFDPAVPAPPGL